MSETFFEVRNLVKIFGKITAVDNVSFKVERREVVTLLGPSGCGKTTTLRMVAGFEKPNAGEVEKDIKPMDLEEVIWAISTRSNPEKDVDILRQTWSGRLDPLISPDDKKRREYFSSKAIIDACRPFPWRNEFPEVCESSPALKEQTLSKWRKSLEHDR